MIINNHHPDSITVLVDNGTYKLSAHSSIKIDIAASSTFHQLSLNHDISDWNNNWSDKMLKAASEITAITVDSVYIISEIREETVIDITNEIVTYEKDDACVIYYGVMAKNAKIELKDCYSPNAKKFLAARKLMLLDDVNDFPVISPIISVLRYKRIKRMLSQRNLWEIVCKKTTFTP